MNIYCMHNNESIDTTSSDAKFLDPNSLMERFLSCIIEDNFRIDIRKKWHSIPHEERNMDKLDSIISDKIETMSKDSFLAIVKFRNEYEKEQEKFWSKNQISFFISK